MRIRQSRPLSRAAVVTLISVAASLASLPAHSALGASRSQERPQALVYDYGGVAASPAVYDKVSGHFELYATTPMGDLEQNAYVVGSGWSGFHTLGTPSSPLSGIPAAAYDTASGNFEIYATGSDGHLWQIAYVPGTGWSSWRDITTTPGPTLGGDPAAYYDPATGNMEVYAVTTNGHLEQAAYHAGWSWHDLGGSVTGTPAALNDTITGNTEIYVTGTDGALYQDAWTGSAWTGVRSLGGAISGSPSAIADSVSGAVEVYATGSGSTGANVEQAAWKSSTGWAWRNLGGSVTGSPSALLDTASGHPEVYATGTAGTLQETAYTTGWGSWSTIGSDNTLYGSPHAVYNQVTGALDVFAIIQGLGDGELAMISWKGGWSSWTSFGPGFNGL